MYTFRTLAWERGGTGLTLEVAEEVSDGDDCLGVNEGASNRQGVLDSVGTDGLLDEHLLAGTGSASAWERAGASHAGKRTAGVLFGNALRICISMSRRGAVDPRYAGGLPMMNAFGVSAAVIVSMKSSKVAQMRVSAYADTTNDARLRARTISAVALAGSMMAITFKRGPSWSGAEREI